MRDIRESSGCGLTDVVERPAPLVHDGRGGATPVRHAGLSVVVITGNEQRNLRRCLASVAWADQIVVVDSFSTDRTVEIAREFTSKVVQSAWPGYAAQKSYAVSLADCRWILSLDADEEVTPELAEAIRHVVEHDAAPPQNGRRRGAGHHELFPSVPRPPSSPPPDGYYLCRRTFFMGRPLRYAMPADWQLRLFRAERVQMLHRLVHETFSTPHPARLHHGLLNHYTADTIQERFETINRFSSLEAEERSRLSLGSPKRRACARALLWPPRSLLGNYLLRLGCLDGLPGLIWCIGGAIEHFLVGVKQWERIRAGELAASGQGRATARQVNLLGDAETGGKFLCG